MTALQSIIKEAKAIRKKSPSIEWKKAVAQASAIYASKHKGKSPVGKKKVGAVKKKAAKKKAVKKHTHCGKVKSYKRKNSKVKTHLRKVSGVGAVKKSATTMHKDTKSHNVNIRVMSGMDHYPIRFTRITNDYNGNPRYVVHYPEFLNSEENAFIPFSKKYDYALKKAKKIGGRKFDNKQYGGGIVFQSYNIEDLEKKIIALRHTTPKIKI
jgi:hypothetical protein